MKFLLILVLFFIFIGLLTGFSIFRFLFGGLFRPDRQRANKQTHKQQNPTSHTSKRQKKIIDSNEGEYIDYEEVKD